MADNKNYFQELNSINVNDHTEAKNGLTYLSWAWAWAELKKRYPDAFYTVYENKDGWNYFHDGGTCWVKTGVTVCGIEHIEYLPIMDFKNKSIPLGSVTSFDVNKAIQRSLTKAVARHGLGLYIYAGEDIPDESDGSQAPAKKAPAKKTTSKPEPAPAAKPASKPEAAPAQEINYRNELRKFIEEYGLDQKDIITKCGLNDNSTNEEWKEALRYAITQANERRKNDPQG